MGQKMGGGCAIFADGARSPSNTKSPRARPTAILSGILVPLHPAVWPQRTFAVYWGLCSLGEGEPGPQLAQCRLGRSLPPYQVAS